ncbi:MAG TPA: ADOP family duplicated permease [Terriglobales bacterium]|nr:ADOP family duplicated permease [Terriglobales bacterium]
MAWRLRRKRRAEDFRAELEAHVDLESELLRERGMGEAGARRAARRTVGNLTRIQERFYESGHWMAGEALWRDLKLALRGLRAAPSFTLAAVATLAVAIGANAVVFAALNAVVRHPLPVPQARSLFVLQPHPDNTSLEESYPDYLAFRDHNRSFDGLAAFSITQVGLEAGGQAAPVWVEEVSGNYFDVLRLQPARGRLLRASDEHGFNSAPEVVISYSFWTTRFHQDPAVVGRVVRFNRHPLTIIGVAPRGFAGTIMFFSPQFFVPLVDEEWFEGANRLQQRAEVSALFVGGIGHLKAGMSQAAAVADLNAIGATLDRSYPKIEQPYSFALRLPGLYGDFLGRPVHGFLAALQLLAALTLLAACLNLASLFAARVTDRQRELALRVALGAGGWRVMRLLWSEAVLVALLGGGIGLGGAVLLLRWLRAWQPFPQFPISIPIRPDAAVYLFALSLALLAGLLFGAGAVARALRSDPYQVIKSGKGVERERLSGTRQWLLAGQLAACALLVTASFVAVRGLVRSLQANYGFNPTGALLVQVDLTTMAGYAGARVPTVQKRLLDSVRSNPAVSAASLADWLPLGMEGWKDQPVFRGHATDLRPSRQAADATVLKISPGYFQAAETPLLAGRDLAETDDATAPRVAVVNQEFARKLFGSLGRATGEEFKLEDGTRVEVVGVAADGKYNSLTEAPQPAMFLPLRQWPVGETWMLVRSPRPPGEVSAAVMSALHGLDPELPFFAEPWSTAMNGALFPARLAAVALGILGAMGALLSITGIFGAAAYAVSRRRRELGIRLALGAGSREVLEASLGPALRVLVLGAGTGLLLGLLTARLLAYVVYQATPNDPLVLAGAVAAMLLVGLIATWVPARRALAIDPLQLLREE